MTFNADTLPSPALPYLPKGLPGFPARPGPLMWQRVAQAPA